MTRISRMGFLSFPFIRVIRVIRGSPQGNSEPSRFVRPKEIQSRPVLFVPSRFVRPWISFCNGLPFTLASRYRAYTSAVN